MISPKRCRKVIFQWYDVSQSNCRGVKHFGFSPFKTGKMSPKAKQHSCSAQVIAGVLSCVYLVGGFNPSEKIHLGLQLDMASQCRLAAVCGFCVATSALALKHREEEKTG